MMEHYPRSNTTDSIQICHHPFLQWSLGFSYIVIIALSLLGNMAVIAVVCLFRQLRTITHYLLMSLAAADLTVTVLVMPFALIYDVTGSWGQGRTFCLFWMSWDVMCCTASLQHLCAIAWDRYVAITDPFNYTNRMSLVRVLLLIICIWINSALISFLPIFMGWFTRSDLIAHLHQCFLDTNPSYAIVSASISFYIPLLGMAFCYSRILSIAWQKVQQNNQQIRSLRDAQRADPASKSLLQIPNAHSEHHHHPQKAHTSHLRDLKATKTLGIVFGMFFCCWWPFFIVYWLDAFLPPGYVTQPLRSLITWLGYCNSSLNPIIYAWNPVFQAAYRKLFLYAVKPCRGDMDSISVNGMISLSNTHDTLGKRSSLRRGSSCMSQRSVHKLGQPLTEEDVKELEMIFWPPSKPIFTKGGATDDQLSIAQDTS
ncbi:hypothetical protein RvY_03452 [Ramazzottius varieornatus]|uniref:G-protein coupled receptors family 1 profile domain-containing protein n=1 Tax=Ramazzottius varieornatus TaxID=947166 RepID=A0A1D1UV58_RAMVA|nr:hypothetical protein RvY_03452 [Ramazzottius varieornatus]